MARYLLHTFRHVQIVLLVSTILRHSGSVISNNDRTLIGLQLPLSLRSDGVAKESMYQKLLSYVCACIKQQTANCIFPMLRFQS